MASSCSTLATLGGITGWLRLWALVATVTAFSCAALFIPHGIVGFDGAGAGGGGGSGGGMSSYEMHSPTDWHFFVPVDQAMHFS